MRIPASLRHVTSLLNVSLSTCASAGLLLPLLLLKKYLFLLLLSYYVLSQMKDQDSLQLEIEGVAGTDPNKEALIVNPAFYLVPGSDLVVARSSGVVLQKL